MIISAYIDRFEGDKAVLYLGEEMIKLNYPKHFLDDTLKEGDYVKLSVEYDAEATQAALEESVALLEDEEENKEIN